MTLSLLHDATVLGDIHYYDVCKVADTVTIAYNNLFSSAVWFRVYQENQTMEEIHVRPVKDLYTYIPRDWEIVKSFLDLYSLIPTWKYCYQTWGVLDKETGTWTGAVGKVRNC